MEKESKKEARIVPIETMTGMGKKKTLAGREYTILPVTIRDMVYIIGKDEENEENEENEKNEEKLIIVDKKKIESEESLDWQVFGLNITNEKRKKVFLDMIGKYVFYMGYPMTEELLVEHNWSFKEIGEFLNIWCQLSD